MTSLSLLALAALAVLTPGARASGDKPGVNLNTILTASPAGEKLLSYLPLSATGALAQTSSTSRNNVELAHREQAREEARQKLLENKTDLSSLPPDMRAELLRYLPHSAKGALAQTSSTSRNNVEQNREETRRQKFLKNKTDPSSRLPPEMREALLRYLPRSDKEAWEKTSRSFKEDVDSVRDITLLEKLLYLFQQLKLPRPEESTIKSLVAAMKASRNKISLPLDLLISTISYGMLHMHLDKVIKLAQIAMSDDNVIDIALDPFSLLQLYRASREDSRIEVLIKKNAKLFKGGLGINEKWLDYGFLKWFMGEIGFMQHIIAIRYSHEDISAILCFVTYSNLDPQVLTGQLSATQEDITKFLELLEFLTRHLAKFHRDMSITAFTRLHSVKSGPPVTDRVPFNIKAGLYACLAHHPRIVELIEGLDSLSIDGIMNKRPLYLKRAIIQQVAEAAGMDAKDMLLAASYPWDGYSLIEIGEFFQQAFTDMADSKVLEWSTQSWLIRKLIKRKKYKAAATILSLNIDYGLLPSHIPATYFVQIRHFFSSIENGADLSISNSSILNDVFGAGPNRT